MIRIARRFIALMFVCATPSQAAVLALDVTGGTPFFVNNDGGATVGWSFDVSAPVVVDALGFFDALPDGLRVSHDVGLWTIGGTLLAQTTVTNASTPVPSTSANGRWLVQDIPDLVLIPGDYVVGAFVFDDDLVDVYFRGPIISTASGITFEEERITFGGGALSFPGTDVPPVTTGRFGPNLLISQAPEPATLALLGLGLAGLGFSRRKRAT